MAKEERYTTQGGVVVKVRPVSQLLIDKAKGSMQLPEPPTYEERIELPGQEPVINHITMTDGSEARKPEEVRAWREYIAKLEQAKSEQGNKMLRAILIPGAARDVKLPDDNSWEEMHELIGVEVPQGDLAKKAHYLLYEVIKSGEDLAGVISTIMRASGVSEEAVRIAESSFRNSLQSPGRDSARQD